MEWKEIEENGGGEGVEVVVKQRGGGVWQQKQWRIVAKRHLQRTRTVERDRK